MAAAGEIGGIPGGVVVGKRSEAEIGRERKGETAEREAEEEVQNGVAGESLRIAGYVLTKIRGNFCYLHHHTTIQHHLFLLPSDLSHTSFAFFLLLLLPMSLDFDDSGP